MVDISNPTMMLNISTSSEQSLYWDIILNSNTYHKNQKL